MALEIEELSLPDNPSRKRKKANSATDAEEIKGIESEEQEKLRKVLKESNFFEKGYSKNQSHCKGTRYCFQKKRIQTESKIEQSKRKIAVDTVEKQGSVSKKIKE
ncbi:hypothetical protein NPIL_529521 [Nephila pilipes]|uniref:Uncharacterized protein n=2 Tax=Nephila pilipes TaxID=299642 RepID=A0A8X6NIS8_NEPPI|nr:hypothetical protein NPIL_529521 [Nephila pilipes]